MGTRKIKRLVRLVEEAQEIVELEVSSWFGIFSIRISKNSDTRESNQLSIQTGSTSRKPAKKTFILSPMVGTLARLLVKIGDRIEVDDPVAIIIAMKLENEVLSEISGTIAEILIKENEPAEFHRPLFRIVP